MNLALVLKLITQLATFAESKPGSKGRAKNLSQAALLGICSAILFYSAGTPEKLANLDKRLAVIEHELKIPTVATVATNAGPGVAAGQLATVGRDSAAPRAVGRDSVEPSKDRRLTFTRKGD